jgi:hypothetical protein
MNNSFFKEALQLSAVGVSKILKRSAKVIETAADVADWPEVKVINQGDSTLLVYDRLDLDPSEIKVSHNGQSIHLNIRPFCQDYLIPNIARFSSWSPKKPEKNASFVAAHQHVRWSTCTADELHRFFSDWLVDPEDEPGKQMWETRAMRMLKPLIGQAICQRDAGRCTLTAAWFKGSLDLDSYLMTMMDSEFADQPLLMGYINEIPGFHISDFQAGSISKKCYEAHGYLTMQVVEMLPTEKRSGAVHMLRMPDRDIAYNFSIKSILSVEAAMVGKALEIRVKHPSKDFVPVTVKDCYSA